MKTKYDVIRAVIAQKVAEGIERDIREQLGYGDRIKKAGTIVLANGVKGTGYNDFEVASGTDSTVTYAVNGTCTCQDAQNWAKHEKGEKVTTFAPRGLCKHKMAVELWKHARIHLKESQERFSLPHHDHRWSCTEHRDLKIECWHRVCPDPIELPCPTCTANVPAAVEQVIAEEGVPVVEYVITPEDQDRGILEEACQVVRDAQVIAQNVDPEYATEEENGPVPTLTLRTEQYEPAPVLAPTLAPMPEAPVSFYIKFKVENFELSYTMRAHTDREVIERLPGVLAGLEGILKIEVDHDEPFLKRLLHAFFPKPSRYTGK